MRLKIYISIFAILVFMLMPHGFGNPQIAEASLANTESTSCRIIVNGVTVRQVQAKVGTRQDGVLGPATCNAIKKYQCTKNLNVDGIVGPNTWGIMRGGSAPRGTRICVDLNHQQLWLTKDGRRTYTAERVRTGDPRLSQASATRTGNFHVYWKDIDHISSIFHSPMPYSMFFSGGQAIHESSFSTPGSHGCINVTHNDAVRLWNASPTGTPVSIWGVRPL